MLVWVICVCIEYFDSIGWPVGRASACMTTDCWLLTVTIWVKISFPCPGVCLSPLSSVAAAKSRMVWHSRTDLLAFCWRNTGCYMRDIVCLCSGCRNDVMDYHQKLSNKHEWVCVTFPHVCSLLSMTVVSLSNQSVRRWTRLWNVGRVAWIPRMLSAFVGDFTPQSKRLKYNYFHSWRRGRRSWDWGGFNPENT